MENINGLQQYTDLVNGKKPVVLFFSADWCSDCRFIDTFFDGIIEDYEAKFDFYKVNPDSQKEICEKANVMGIPSFVAYQDGRVIAEFISNSGKTKAEIENFLRTAEVKVIS
ncbi:thioredoxin family protein [Psychrobacillus soli]|uniref:Thioredoxin family protein n=1 Tax=Psychrobacillus soli TaxID=1543965 RepID=A0A544TLL9_9BACI|nr:thioredoxin family protein [Psychrobacillus soli]TQR18315.1 thioredoxin family protein [Psychrobacillus soli]